MRWNDAITLISRITTEDEIGNPVVVDNERLVYANKFSVSNSLQVGAAAANKRIEKIYEIMTADYAGEKQAKADGILFQVFNAEEKGDRTRLSLEKVN